MTEQLEALFGDVSVTQMRFGAPSDDEVSGGTASQRSAIRDCLKVDLWEVFCEYEWETRRKAYDAAAPQAHVIDLGEALKRSLET